MVSVAETETKGRLSMIGAIIGDIVGSSYEMNSLNMKSKDFEIFTPYGSFIEFSGYTDDSICTIAVATAIDITRTTKTDFTENVRDCLVDFSKKFPHRGYGSGFGAWVYSEDHKPYGSTGNGAAMRISPCAWMANSEQECEYFATETTNVTHNSEEGLSWGLAIAKANYALLHGASKKDIIDLMPDKTWALKDIDTIRNEGRNSCRCRDSVPQSVAAFLCGDSFEDVLRNAVSLGFDTDTQASIACSLAQTIYEIPEQYLIATARKIKTTVPDKLDSLSFWIKKTMHFDVFAYD